MERHCPKQIFLKCQTSERLNRNLLKVLRPIVLIAVKRKLTTVFNNGATRLDPQKHQILIRQLLRSHDL